LIRYLNPTVLALLFQALHTVWVNNFDWQYSYTRFVSACWYNWTVHYTEVKHWKWVIVARNIDIDNDYRRAAYLLKEKINTAADLVKIWSYAGPCSENCPSIEKISRK